MKKIIKNVYERFLSKKPPLGEYDLIKGFTAEQKKWIVDTAITTSCQVLISAVVMADIDSHIEGEVILPDGTRWVLKFNKKWKL